MSRDDAAGELMTIWSQPSTTREDRVDELNTETELLLAGMRRLSWLHYTPDVRNQKLVRTSEVTSAEWLEKFPEGSHRYPHEWLSQREAPMDEETGQPEAPKPAVSEFFTTAGLHGLVVGAVTTSVLGPAASCATTSPAPLWSWDHPAAATRRLASSSSCGFNGGGEDATTVVL